MMLWDKTEHTYRDIEATPGWLVDLSAVNARVCDANHSGQVTFVWVLDDLIGVAPWPTDELREGYIRLLAKYIVWTCMFPREHMRHCLRHYLGEILLAEGHVDDTDDLQSYRHVDYPRVEDWCVSETPRFVQVTMHWATGRSLVDA